MSISRERKAGALMLVALVAILIPSCLSAGPVGEPLPDAVERLDRE